MHVEKRDLILTKFIEINNLNSKDAWSFENGFFWFTHKSRLNKTLAHYEIYKLISHLPGDIFEFGVYKGASLIRFATFRDTLENNYSRKIFGFDVFGEFPKINISMKEDLEFINKFENQGGDGLTVDQVHDLIKFKGFENIELIKGNVFDTLIPFLNENPEVRISLLHLDMDVKEPTDYVLDLLYEKLVPGGLIVFDDYGTVAGETMAVDNFVKNYNLKLEKLPFYKIPSFLKKPL